MKACNRCNSTILKKTVTKEYEQDSDGSWTLLQDDPAMLEEESTEYFCDDCDDWCHIHDTEDEEK